MASGAVDRRRFLAGAAGLAGGFALAACGSSGDDNDTGAVGPTGGGGNSSASPTAGSGPTGGGSSAGGGSASGSITPTYVPFDKVKPDIPAGDHGIPAGFYHYPADPSTFVDHPLGNGEEISFLLQGSAIATPLSRNKWWQAVNEAVNAKLKLNVVNNAGSSTTYTAKLQTTIAGGDLPDVLQLVTLPSMPGVLEAEFADLTEYLAGDAIKQFPGLASIPTATWQIPTLNGKIWGVAQPRPAAGTVPNTRGDSLKAFGIDSNSPELSSGDDFLELCKQLTDSKRNKYAIAEEPSTWVLNATKEMMGAPNIWKEEGGKFTSTNETEETKEALNTVVKMWKAGYIHPDSFATPSKNYTWWRGGNSTIFFQSFAGWSGAQIQYPTFDVGVLTLPKALLTL